ncbi:hypothetical protein UlMin_010761 [Ulmus minor]
MAELVQYGSKAYKKYRSLSQNNISFYMVLVCVAHELLHAEEFITGHAPGAVNIPCMYKVGSCIYISTSLSKKNGMTKNLHFLAEVSKYFRKYAEIISGKRSMIAATDLLASVNENCLGCLVLTLRGYSCITDIAGGYATWTQNALPRSCSGVFGWKESLIY